MENQCTLNDPEELLASHVRVGKLEWNYIINEEKFATGKKHQNAKL